MLPSIDKIDLRDPETRKYVARLAHIVKDHNFQSFVRSSEGRGHRDFENFIENASFEEFDVLSSQITLEKYKRFITSSGINTSKVEEFSNHQKKLIDLEIKQVEENFSKDFDAQGVYGLRDQGEALVELKVIRSKRGIDKFYVEFRHDDDQLLICNILAGDWVILVSESDATKSWEGFVADIDDFTITLKLDEYPSSQTTFWLALKKSHKRFVNDKRTLEKLYIASLASEHIAHPIMNCLLGGVGSKNTNSQKQNLSFRDTELDQIQRDIVTKALGSDPLFLIEGPFGTGKTRLLREIIYQCAVKGLKVLACAPNNTAVDNLIDPKNYSSILSCRFGFSQRTTSDMDMICLENLYKKNKLYQFFYNKGEKINSLLNHPMSDDTRDILNKLQSHAKESMPIFAQEIQQIILQYCQVIYVNLTDLNDPFFESWETEFDVVIIDECAQSTQIDCWAALLRARRAIFACDPLQLPPVINNKACKELEHTIDRTIKSVMKDMFISRLQTQYRMNEHIMSLGNECFYAGKLKAGSSCKNITLNNMIRSNSFIHKGDSPSLLLIDTSTNPKDCQELKFERNYINFGEAAIVLFLLDYLRNNFTLSAEDIGVITTYKAQSDLINALLTYGPKHQGTLCSTVNGFQGKEKEAIIISLVRTDDIGFIDDPRRLNVALSRTKRFVALIVNFQLAQQSQTLNKIVNTIMESKHSICWRAPRDQDLAVYLNLVHMHFSQFGIKHLPKIERFQLPKPSSSLEPNRIPFIEGSSLKRNENEQSGQKSKKNKPQFDKEISTENTRREQISRFIAHQNENKHVNVEVQTESISYAPEKRTDENLIRVQNFEKKLNENASEILKQKELHNNTSHKNRSQRKDSNNTVKEKVRTNNHEESKKEEIKVQDHISPKRVEEEKIANNISNPITKESDQTVSQSGNGKINQETNSWEQKIDFKKKIKKVEDAPKKKSTVKGPKNERLNLNEQEFPPLPSQK